MLWTATNILLFVFVYSTIGVPLHDVPKRKLTRRAIPSQWGKESEISYYWPKGEVPYVFDDKSYDDGVKARVQIAMAALERDSCIRFKEHKGEGEGSWLHFTNPDTQRQCSHEPSYQDEGEIQVVLGYDCLRQRDIMHSLLHGVGFRDEISHPQRDLFVKIMWENIQSAYKSMFRIQSVEHSNGLVEYDPMSIMHFHDRAYSLNGQATITPLLPGLRIAPSDKLSHLDKMKLRVIFGHECNKRKVGEVLDKCKGILTQYDESELTPKKPEDDNLPNNEDVRDEPNENNGDNPLVDQNAENDTKVDPDAGGNNDRDEETAKNGAEEGIIVGNDLQGNEDGKKEEIVNPNASSNTNGDEETAKNGPEEVIIVGNAIEGNGKQEQIVDPSAGGNNDGNEDVNGEGVEEAIVAGDVTETVNVGPNEDMIIENGGADNVNENPVN